MKPVIKELARQYKDVLFLIVDTEANPWYRRHRSLQSDGIPHFVFFNEGRKVAEVSGADPDGVRAQVVRLDRRAPPLARSATASSGSNTSLLSMSDFEGQAFELQGLKSRADLNGTACIGSTIKADALKPYVVQICGDATGTMKFIAVSGKNINSRPKAREVYTIAIALYTSQGCDNAVQCNSKAVQTAAKLLEKAANDGNANAQKAIGLCYDKGHGVRCDQQKAFKWYLQAAEAGHSQAMCNVGLYLLHFPRAVRSDPEAACRWLSSAVRAGNDSACMQLAECYEKGRGVPVDLKRAISLYETALARGGSSGDQAGILPTLLALKARVQETERQNEEQAATERLRKGRLEQRKLQEEQTKERRRAEAAQREAGVLESARRRVQAEAEATQQKNQHDAEKAKQISKLVNTLINVGFTDSVLNRKVLERNNGDLDASLIELSAMDGSGHEQGDGDGVKGSVTAAAAGGGTITVGATVTISGLKAKPELNGMQGRVLCPSENGERWVIHVDAATQLALKPGSLTLSVAGEDMAAGGSSGGSSSGDGSSSHGGGGDADGADASPQEVDGAPLLLPSWCVKGAAVHYTRTAQKATIVEVHPQMPADTSWYVTIKFTDNGSTRETTIDTISSWSTWEESQLSLADVARPPDPWIKEWANPFVQSLGHQYRHPTTGVICSSILDILSIEAQPKGGAAGVPATAAISMPAPVQQDGDAAALCLESHADDDRVATGQTDDDDFERLLVPATQNEGVESTPAITPPPNSGHFFSTAAAPAAPTPAPLLMKDAAYEVSPKAGPPSPTIPMSLPVHEGPAPTEPAPNDSPARAKSFATSLYLQMYDSIKKPKRQHELLAAVDNLLEVYCNQPGQKYGPTYRDVFFKALEAEAFEHQDELLGEIPAAAQRFWTSGIHIDVANKEGPELCSIIQHAIRSDTKDFLEPALILCRAINELCVARRVEEKEEIPFPKEGLIFRGGLLPFEHHAFYTDIGKQYRVPGYLATSFDEKVTLGFRKRAFKAEKVAARLEGRPANPAVLFIIQVDPAGEEDEDALNQNANLVQKTNVAGESEYLFVPYSVFTVTKCEWQAKPNYQNPHKIYLDAAADNDLADEDLPNAPWY